MTDPLTRMGYRHKPTRRERELVVRWLLGDHERLDWCDECRMCWLRGEPERHAWHCSRGEWGSHD